MHYNYINLGLLVIIIGLVISVYVHTDRKIEKLSDKITEVDNKLSAKITEVDNKLSAKIERLSDRMDKLSDRMDRIYDILVRMGFRDKEYRDKAANE
jgi:flagellar capping protein FliD